MKNTKSYLFVNVVNVRFKIHVCANLHFGRGKTAQNHFFFSTLWIKILELENLVKKKLRVNLKTAIRKKCYLALGHK